MTHSQAEKIRRAFYDKPNPDEDDLFLFTEAMEFLIAETHEAKYMTELGGEYYSERRFDLAEKYYRMAAELGDIYACSGMGYIYYYGRLGEPDYEKAFEYYSKAAEKGDLQCAYKIADMYRNGYYVAKNEEKYKEIIEALYPKVKDAVNLGAPLPEIFSRLGKIRAEEGKKDEALDLFWIARDFLAQRIRYNPFFGNLTIMKFLIRDIYSLTDFDPWNFSLYDLYWLMREPKKVRFFYEGEEHRVESMVEDGQCVLCLDGEHWFRTVDDFFLKAELSRRLLVTLGDELDLFEVIA